MHLGEVEEAVVLGAREARRRARQRLEQLVIDQLASRPRATELIGLAGAAKGLRHVVVPLVSLHGHQGIFLGESASKLTERMYVPLASSTREQRSAEEARRPELELQLLDRLDWKINIITPYGLRATALEAVYALLPLPAIAPYAEVPEFWLEVASSRS